jgi:hypothetical protein
VFPGANVSVLPTGVIEDIPRSYAPNRDDSEYIEDTPLVEPNLQRQDMPTPTPYSKILGHVYQPPQNSTPIQPKLILDSLNNNNLSENIDDYEIRKNQLRESYPDETEKQLENRLTIIDNDRWSKILNKNGVDISQEEINFMINMLKRKYPGDEWTHKAVMDNLFQDTTVEGIPAYFNPYKDRKVVEREINPPPPGNIRK